MAWCLQERDAKGADSDTKPGHLIPVIGGGFDDAIPFDTTQITSAANYSRPQAGDPSHPLAAGAHPPAIAFSCKDHGADAAPTLRAMGHSGSHANAGGQVAICIKGAAIGRKPENGPQYGEYLVDSAFTQNCTEVHAVAFESRFARNGRGAPDEVVPPLKAQSGETGKGDAAPLVAFHNRQDPDVSGDVTHPLGAKDNGLGLGPQMQVRRLTPRECERLQGFPDDYTLIPHRGKPAADGPRYKALGNSMAVPVMAWIGRQISAARTPR